MHGALERIYIYSRQHEGQRDRVCLAVSFVTIQA
jgi:hypothetical protein